MVDAELPSVPNRAHNVDVGTVHWKAAYVVSDFCSLGLRPKSQVHVRMSLAQP